MTVIEQQERSMNICARLFLPRFVTQKGMILLRERPSYFVSDPSFKMLDICDFFNCSTIRGY